MIDAAVLGTAVKEAEPRTSASRKIWTSVILRSGDGDAAQFVQVSVFGDTAVALGRIERGERLYAEGSIRINEWTSAAGEKRTRLSMAAWRAERPGIGRNKPKRDAKPEAPLQPASGRGRRLEVTGPRGTNRSSSARRRTRWSSTTTNRAGDDRGRRAVPYD
jgi:single-stranded DNA-binding protein